MPKKIMTRDAKKRTIKKINKSKYKLGIKTIKSENTSKNNEIFLQEPSVIDSFETTQSLNSADTEPEYEFKLPQEEVTISDAPFWRRSLAYIIDCAFFYFVPFQIFMYIYLSQTGLLFSDMSGLQEYIMHNTSAQIKIMAGFVAALFIFLFYFMIAEKNFKTTIGKKIMGLQLSGRLEYWDILLRNLTKTVFIWLLPLDLLGYLVWKKRITERFSGTKVIYYVKLALSYEMF